MSFQEDGHLVTEPRQGSYTWDSDTEWNNAQETEDVTVENGLVKLAEISFPENGLIMHQDAQSLSKTDGDPVDPWPDVTVNGNDLVQASNSDTAPTYDADGMNGNPAVYHPGGSSTLAVLETTSLPSKSEVNLFIVCERATSPPNTGEEVSWGHGQNDGFAQHYTYTDGYIYDGTFQDQRNIEGISPSIGLDQTHVVEVKSSGTVHEIIQNDTSVASAGSPGFDDSSTFYLFADSDQDNRSWNGWFGEIFLYDRILSSSERSDLKSHIYSRWGISP